MYQQKMCLILLKVEQSTFTQASFSSLSDVREYLGGLQMATSSLGKQTADRITIQLADEFVHGFSCFAWHVEVKMAQIQVFWLFLVKM